MLTLVLAATMAAFPTLTPACRVGDPLVAIAMMPGLTNTPLGVVVAVWPDGRILRARVATDPERGHVVGKLSEAEMATLLRVVSESGIWKSTQPSMPFDVREDLIAVCKGARRRSLTDMTGSHPRSAQRRLERFLRNLRVVEPAATQVPEDWINWFRPEEESEVP